MDNNRPKLKFVPVMSSTGTPLMPCHPGRARELIRNGKAKKQFKRGVFYIKLLDRDSGDMQEELQSSSDLLNQLLKEKSDSKKKIAAGKPND